MPDHLHPVGGLARLPPLKLHLATFKMKGVHSKYKGERHDKKIMNGEVWMIEIVYPGIINTGFASIPQSS